MSDDEQRFTLREARLKLRQDECRRGGHAPGHHIVQMDGTPSAAYCDCGLYRFEPVKTTDGPGGIRFGDDATSNVVIHSNAVRVASAPVVWIDGKGNETLTEPSAEGREEDR